MDRKFILVFPINEMTRADVLEICGGGVHAEYTIGAHHIMTLLLNTDSKAAMLLVLKYSEIIMHGL